MIGLRLVRFRMRRIVRAGQRRLLMLYGCLASAQMAHGSPDLPASAAKPCVSCLTVGPRYLHLPVAGSAAVRNDVGVLGLRPWGQRLLQSGPCWASERGSKSRPELEPAPAEAHEPRDGPIHHFA